MKIVEQSDRRLVLRGSPSGAAAAAVGLGLLAVAGVGALILLAAGPGGGVLGRVVPLLILAIFGIAGLAALFTAAMRREELVLDGATGECIHRVWWRVLGREKKQTAFAASSVDHVALAFRLERSAGGRGGGGASEHEVWEAVVRVKSPRRVFVLASASRESAVRPLAEAAAVALGVKLIDEAGDEREAVAGEETREPLARRRAGRASLAELPAAPAGTRVRVAVCGEADAARVSLEWRLLRKPWIMLPFAAITGLFTLMSIAFFALALGIIGSKPAGAAASVGCFGLVLLSGAFMYFFVAIGWLARVRVEITPESAAAFADFPGRRLIPGARARLARRTIPLAEVESVRSRSATDHVEIVSDRCSLRAWVHLPEEGELAWVAATIRAAAAALS